MKGAIKGRGVIKGAIKGAHQSCAIWIKQLAIYQIFRTTVFTTKCMINNDNTTNMLSDKNNDEVTGIDCLLQNTIGKFKTHSIMNVT